MHESADEKNDEGSDTRFRRRHADLLQYVRGRSQRHIINLINSRSTHVKEHVQRNQCRYSSTHTERCMFTVLFLSMFEIKRRSRAFVTFVGVNLVRTVRLCGDDDVAFDIVFSTFLSHKKKIWKFSLLSLFLSLSLRYTPRFVKSFRFWNEIVYDPHQKITFLSHTPKNQLRRERELEDTKEKKCWGILGK